MSAEFDWWLLIVGVVAGAGLTWLVLADSSRRDQDILERELPAEAGWLSRTLADEGFDVDPDLAEAILRAHRRYLGLPPPDALVDPETLERVDAGTQAPGPVRPTQPPDRAAATATGTSAGPAPHHPKRGGAVEV
jgi:hypothetical protein